MKAREFLKGCEGGAGKLLKEYADVFRNNADGLDKFYGRVRETAEFPTPYIQVNRFGSLVMFAISPLMYACSGLNSFPEAMFNYAKKSFLDK